MAAADSLLLPRSQAGGIELELMQAPMPHHEPDETDPGSTVVEVVEERLARARRRLNVGGPVDGRPTAVSSSDRRSRLLAALATSDGPISGDVLAARFGVSRQAIVHDVALLRAAGEPIVATVRGYLVASTVSRLPNRVVVAVRHGPERAEVELLAIVDLGIRVVDVIVEHPTYGELRGELHLHAPAEVRAWSEATRREGAHLLSELTGGVHLHTLEAATPALLDRARAVLAELGFLLDER